MLLKDSDAACRWVPSNFFRVDHHVDSGYARSVQLVRRVHLGGQLWEELEELRLAGLDLELVVIVELDQISLECVQMRRHGRKIVSRHDRVLQARGRGRRIALLSFQFLRLVRGPVLLARPLEAIKRQLHLILLLLVIPLVIAVIEESDRGAPLMVNWQILLICDQLRLARRANLFLVIAFVLALIIDHCDEVLRQVLPGRPNAAVLHLLRRGEHGLVRWGSLIGHGILVFDAFGLGRGDHLCWLRVVLRAP